MEKNSGDSFESYKRYLLDKVDQFQACQAEHKKDFLRLHDSIDDVEKTLLKEMKELRSLADRIDKRLVLVEVKSGALGALAGALPYIIKMLGGD